MAYNAKGRIKYGSYLDKSSFSEGGIKYTNESELTKIAKKIRANLPAEFKYDIPGLMVKLNPTWLKPYHQKPLLDAFDKIQRGMRVKLLVSEPPRFSKTECMLHGIARYLITHKNKEVLYLSYAQDIAEDKSRIVRGYVQELGCETLRDTNSLASWKLTNGCVFRCAGLAGGQITGKGADLLVIDDPHKDRADVESGTKRERCYNSVTADVMTRLSPEASIICTHTRWHNDDLIGRLVRNPDVEFEYINLPALKEDGTSLWPERWTAERLLETKSLIGPYDWASLYMGDPRPRGASLFNGLEDSNYYKELPSRLRFAVGYDLAYTAKTYADYSVAIVMATDGSKFYIVDVVRMQVDATRFSQELKTLRNKYPQSTFLSYISGPEKGSVSLLNSTGLNLSYLPARTDKFDRAQSVSAAWNAGNILLPKSAPWLNKFISEISHFTGVSDPQDDQVDALAGAYAALSIRQVRRNLNHLPPA